MQCMVYGCRNNSDQGYFVGKMCAPCHDLITKGVLALEEAGEQVRGTSFIHILIRQNKDYAATISRAREALKPGRGD